jgi:hypothetical protein
VTGAEISAASVSGRSLHLLARKESQHDPIMVEEVVEGTIMALEAPKAKTSR